MFNYCLILAAGEGSRLRPLTEFTPKAMVEVGGKPIIYYSLSQVNSVILNTIVTVGYIGEKVSQYVLEEGATQTLDTYPHGNAFWLFNSILKNVNEPVLVLTCDNIVEIDLEWIENEYNVSRPPCLLVPVKPIEGISGDYITGEDHLVSRLSRNKFEEAQVYCSGIQVMNPYLINSLMEPMDDFYEVWSSLIFQKKLSYSNIYPHPWFSINTPSQLNQYNAQLKTEKVNENL